MLFALLVEYTAETFPDELMQAHRDWLFPRFEEGSFLISGSLDAVDENPPSALAIFTADSLEEARTLVDSEPFFRAGACRHRVVPFHVRVRAAELDTAFPDDTKVLSARPGRGDETP
ncbi:YciI family protein [Streptomyces sp. NPDC096040]|uniref:YciI family protein n=1 Tax=Streptomyces sp. NPDC096040 TaxID=3155541 RepID=UPI003320B976